MTPLRVIAAGLAGLLLSTGSVVSAPFTLLQPSGDRWMYWQGDFSGVRVSASVYGAYGPFDYLDFGYDFDDRHAQMFLDFDTTQIAQPGLGAENYAVSSLVVSIVVDQGDAFVYDPTHDPLATYTGAADPDFGRPLELFGVGYRSGFSLASFRENSTYQSANATGFKNVRNAYAMDFIDGLPRDVSNNVEQNFEVAPWAIGQFTGSVALDGSFSPGFLQAGQLVPWDAVMEFTVDLSNPLIRAYVQAGLHAGRLQFMVSSLLGYEYEGDEGAGGGFPSFYTKESTYHAPQDNIFLAAQLSGDVAVQSAPVHCPELSISHNSASGQKRIWFYAQEGHSYQFQFRDDLVSGQWSDLGSAQNGSAGQIIEEFDLPSAGKHRRFYQVVVTRTQS